MELINDPLGDGDNFIKTDQFKEKIQQLNGSVHLLLDEFKKLYVITKMHPTNEEYQIQYQTINISYFFFIRFINNFDKTFKWFLLSRY